MNNNLSLIEPGLLNIGVDESAPLPLHSDPNLPEFEGFEVDLMRLVAARLGLSVRYKNALWSKLLDDLLEGRVDMICTAATITNERKEFFDFSQPYLNVKLAIVTRNESSIGALADFRERIVGVRIDTSAEAFLRKHAQARLFRTFDLNMELYKTLQAGEVDAAVDDLPIAQAFASSLSGLKIAATVPGSDARYGMMFKKGNDELLTAINDALTKIKTDGTYAQLYRKWFNENAAAVTSNLGDVSWDYVD